MRLGGLALVALCGASAVVAQTTPAETVRRVARQVEEDMQQIDQMLRQASKEQAENSLATAQWQQGQVLHGIDDLLEALHEVECTCPGGT